jgi:hypothetical protein
LLEEIKKEKCLNYYYSKDELKEYYNEWLVKSTNKKDSYSYNEYKVYENISIENCHIDKIQLDHYLDEGCRCKACRIKRLEVIGKILNGVEVKDRIAHTKAKNELIEKRATKVNRINALINNIPSKIRGKNFKGDMRTIVGNTNMRFSPFK